jgi:hypothetical protein
MPTGDACDGHKSGLGNLRAHGQVQALLHDHAKCGNHTAADVVAKAQAVLSEPELLRAMFDIGYFPPNMPPEP